MKKPHGNLGKVRTPEMKEKMAAAKRGKPVSDETRAAMSARKKGKSRSDADRARIAEGLRAYWAARRSQDDQPS